MPLQLSNRHENVFVRHGDTGHRQSVANGGIRIVDSEHLFELFDLRFVLFRHHLLSFDLGFYSLGPFRFGGFLKLGERLFRLLQ